MFLAPCWGEGFRESEGGKAKAKKTKTLSQFFLSPLSSFPSFHVLFLSFFLSLFLSLSFFHYFFSLSFFFSSLSCWAKKITKITEIIENTQKSLKSLKSLKSPKIPQNPTKIGVPKITFANITKHYENRGEKNRWNATRQVKIGHLDEDKFALNKDFRLI